MNIKMNVKMTGKEIIEKMIEVGKGQMIIDEILSLRSDLSTTEKGVYELKDIDNQWNTLSKWDRINKGKRFKEYLISGYVTGISIVKDKANQPIEYEVQ